MNDINAITVFCGSSEGNDTSILDMAANLGRILAGQDITLVYGAAKIGIMGKVAENAINAGGKVVGVIPEFLKLKEVVHLGLSELITTSNMHERKVNMNDLADAFIALPGGFGTLEELFEIITWAQLGLHEKPIGLLNINGFYDDLLQLLENMVRKGFLKISNYEMLLVDDSVEGLLDKLRHYKAEPVPKWLKANRT